MSRCAQSSVQSLLRTQTSAETLADPCATLAAFAQLQLPTKVKDPHGETAADNAELLALSEVANAKPLTLRTTPYTIGACQVQRKNTTKEVESRGSQETGPSGDLRDTFGPHEMLIDEQDWFPLQ